jgi:hypothetical protein
MDLQNWLNTSDYISEFKRNHVSFRKYPDKGLLIVKRKYGSSYSEDTFWLNYCRGLVIDTTTNQAIMIPPVKAKEVQKIDELPELSTNLVDGTMINVFFYKNEWLISSRSNIGCTNKWSSELTFMDMFQECSKNLDMDELDKENTYSFVMRHKKQRLTTPVTENCLVLVEVYYKLERVNELPTNKGYICIQNWSSDTISKGKTCFHNHTRYKWLTTEHKFIQMIQPNTTNPCLNYLIIRNSGHLTNYLQLFPEKRFEFDKYRKKLHLFTELLYKYYVSVFIKKNSEKTDVPFSLKPFLYELHKIYLTTKQGISWSIVKQYIYELEPKRIQFAFNNL